MTNPTSKLIIHGEAGAILITDKGSRRLPPFHLSIQKQLRSLNELIHAAYIEIGSQKQNIEQQVNRLANQVIGTLEDIVGPLHPENGLVYDDEDGGFICGSTGKPPIPLPPEPLPYGNIGDFLESGIINADIVDFLTKVNAKNINLLEFFENPAQTAEELGVKLSDQTLTDLQSLSSSKLNEIDHDHLKELLEFFHKVIEDGRFIDDWIYRPAHVSEELGVMLDQKTLEDIMMLGAIKDNTHEATPALGTPVMAAPGAAIAVVVVGIVVLVAASADSSVSRINSLIKDRSDIKKF